MTIGQTFMAFGIIIGSMLGVFFLLAVFLMIWVKQVTKGKFYITFYEPNNEETRRLMRPSSNYIMDTEYGDKTRYVIHPKKIRWTMWPPGFPRFLQEKVATLHYVRNNPEPIDPYGKEQPIVTARGLRSLLDEEFVGAAWKEAQKTVSELMGKPVSLVNVLPILMSVLTVVLIGVTLYFNLKMAGQVSQILTLLGGK